MSCSSRSKTARRRANFIVFADGFAGAVKEPGQRRSALSGLAVGPDGALYISEDTHGRIWRVTFHGDPNAGTTPAPTPKIAAVSSGEPGPPEGTHPDAGGFASVSLPVPPGATKGEVALRKQGALAVGSTTPKLSSSVKKVC